LQDEIMRLFGGERVDGLMQRLQIDDALPLENNLVSNMIEQSQTRVEGANFDARKHVLEYDDVLNAQRASIYGQRDRIFTKEDLSEDVQEMLETEINERVPLALADDEGPWRLLAWLEQIQPTFATSEGLFPSFTLKLLLDEVRENGLGTQDEALKSLHQLAERALEVEQEHFLNSISELLKSSDKALETQLAERLDVLDTFFEGLEYTDETDTRGAKELLDELSQLARFPLRLSNREQKLLREDPYEAKELVAEQLENFMTVQAVTRVLGAVERRLNQPLDLSADELAQEEWKVVSEKVLAAIRAAFDDRKAALIGQNGDGQIARDLEPQLAKLNGNYSDTQLLGLMVMMTQGAMTTFDKKTHQRVTQQTTRLNYAYYAAQLLEGISPEKATKRVLAHLQKAHEAVRQAWSRSEWARAAKLGLAELDEKSKEYLQANLDGQTLAALGDQPLEQAEKSVQEQIAALLGARALSEIYRQLLLRVISELWVDYLTSMEALRVSIGLEAYGQRDPLVQYKARAFEMFQKLFSDMRIGVVSRMFTYRPQALRAAAADGQQLAPPQLGAQPQIRPAPAQAGPQPAAQQTPPKKKQKVEPRKKQRRRK
jgi:preprotein translocase subunit SecA